MCVCVCVFRWGTFQFPWQKDGFQVHLEENIYSVANIKMTSSVISNEGKSDEECGGLSREYYLPTPSYEGVFCRWGEDVKCYGHFTKIYGIC